MGEIRVKAKLTNATDDANAVSGIIGESQVRSLSIEAVVDAGAVRSVIPEAMIDQIGVRVRGSETIRYADGRVETLRLTTPILFEIQGRSTADEALVLGDEVLIGQTVLEKLDFLADCKNQRLVPNPAHPDGPILRI